MALGLQRCVWYCSEDFAVVNAFKPHENLGVSILQRRSKRVQGDMP